MKKTACLIWICLLCLSFAACRVQEDNGSVTENDVISSVTGHDATSSAAATETTLSDYELALQEAQAAAESARKAIEEGMPILINPVMPATSEKMVFEWKGARYEGTRFLSSDRKHHIERIISMEKAVEIPSFVPSQGNLTVVSPDFDMECPNLEELTIGKDYTVMRLPRSNSDMYRAQVLTLPSGFAIFNFWDSGKYYTNGYSGDPLVEPFPTVFTELKEIRVEDATHGDPIWSVDGMLYTMRKLGTNAQSTLVCLPQNYPSEDGTVSIPARTTFIQTHAVYLLRNVTRLIIPAQVGAIDPEGIVAIAERPLTVVCAKGSAADEYVRLYGEEFHLTVEYLPE